MTYFWNNLENFGSATAVIEPSGSETSYLKLCEKADFLASTLDEKSGVALIEMNNELEAVSAYIGALRKGVVVILVEPENKTLSENLLRKYRPDYVFKELEGFTRLTDSPDEMRPHQDLALGLTTSGSTGSPKLVRISKSALDSNARAIASYLSLSARDKALMTLPLHYCYGLSVLNSHLSAGASAVLGQTSVTDPEFIPRLKRFGVTGFAGVPLTFEALEALKFRDTPLTSLRYVTQAGGRLSSELVKLYARWASQHKRDFFVMYGQTEATARMAYLPPKQAETFPECIGRAIPGGELFLKDEFGNEVTDFNTPGALFYRGPNVMMGYAETRADLSKPGELAVLDTGDIAQFNSYGLFSIVGRSKRISKVYGKRTNLDDIEKNLHQRFGQLVCLSDDKKIYVVSREDLDESRLRKQLKEQFDLRPSAISIHKVTDFPLLGSQKIDYQSLLRTCKREEGVKPTSFTEPGLFESSVRQRLVNFYQGSMAVDTIDTNLSFTQLGGDSISYVGLSIALEQEFEDLPDHWHNLSVDELASVLHRRESGSKTLSLVATDSSIAARALAPIAIVLNHAGFTWLAGGAAALMLVAGFNFARFSLGDIDSRSWVKPLSQFAANVLIPYWGLVILYQIYKGSLSLPELLLFNNLTGMVSATPFATWFVQALLQCLVFCTIVFHLLRKISSNSIKITHIAMALFLLAGIARLTDEYFLYDLLGNRGKQFTWIFWLFTGGILIALADSMRSRYLVAAAMTIASISFYSGDWSRIVAVVFCSYVLLFVPKIKVPQPFLSVLGVLGASSLFIYMLHPSAPIGLMTDKFWGIDLIHIVSGIGMGIVGWFCYTRIWNRVKQHMI